MGLPSGYRQLTYIQSTGTQYVDTGVQPDQDTRVKIKLSTKETGSHTILGADVSWTGNGFALGPAFAHYGAANGTISGLNTSAVHEVDFNKNVISIDGTAALTMESFTFSVAYNMALFANNRAGSIQEKATMALYACQIYHDGVLIRDFVPCINASGTVGLYDLVGQQFYSSATSTALLGGGTYDN